MWWPWGARARRPNEARSQTPATPATPGFEQTLRGGPSARLLTNRAGLLKERAKKTPDPRAEALEVGAAFAEAAAATSREDRRSHHGDQGSRADDQVAELEREARDFLRAACVGSDPKVVLRRAASVSVLRECVRKRQFMRPEKRRESLIKARRLHAREMAAERRRQRYRRQCAHLALLRDALRRKGRPGRCSSSAVAPDVRAAVRHCRGFIDLFALEDEDATCSEDEDDYHGLVTYFCGDKGAVKKEEQERLLAEQAELSQEMIDACVKAGQLFDRDHSRRNSTVAVDRLRISCRVQTLETIGARSAPAALPVPPTMSRRSSASVSKTTGTSLTRESSTTPSTTPAQSRRASAATDPRSRQSSLSSHHATPTESAAVTPSPSVVGATPPTSAAVTPSHSVIGATPPASASVTPGVTPSHSVMGATPPASTGVTPSHSVVGATMDAMLSPEIVVRPSRKAPAMMSPGKSPTKPTLYDLPPPPTREELRADRDKALTILHDLFHVRGVRHLDSDVSDRKWRTQSERHLVDGELGALQDEWRAVLEE